MGIPAIYPLPGYVFQRPGPPRIWQVSPALNPSSHPNEPIFITHFRLHPGCAEESEAIPSRFNFLSRVLPVIIRKAEKMLKSLFYYTINLSFRI